VSEKLLWAIEYRAKGRKPVIMSELGVPLLFATRRDAAYHMRRWGNYLRDTVRPQKMIVKLEAATGGEGSDEK